MISKDNNEGIGVLPQLGNQDLVMWFGQMLLQHFAPRNQYTVSEWIDHVIETKDGAGRKRKTLSGYRYCAIRVKKLIGDRLLAEIQPTDISDLFAELKKEAAQIETRAELKKGVDLLQMLRDRGLSQTRLAKAAHISQSTVDRAVNGLHILLPKAQAIAGVLGMEWEQLFAPVQGQRKLSATVIYWLCQEAPGPRLIVLIGLVIYAFICYAVFSCPDGGQSIYTYIARWVRFLRIQQNFKYKQRQEVLRIALVKKGRE